MSDKVEPKDLLEQIRSYLKAREGHYTAGDRELANLFKQADIHLSRLAGLGSSNESPGSKAATVSAQNEQRSTPGGTQYDTKPTEPRDVSNQPKTFEAAREAFDDAHSKFMEQVGAGKEGDK